MRVRGVSRGECGPSGGQKITQALAAKGAGVVVSVAALGAILLGVKSAAADTIAPPPTEFFVAPSDPQTPADTASQQPQAAPSGATEPQQSPAAATPAVGAIPSANTPAPPAENAPASAAAAENALAAPHVAAIPEWEMAGKEQAVLVLQPPEPPPPPPTPAELLRLAGKERAKAEKCLTNAVYFEARGEPLRGQVAVAQVVLNRVFSPYYPNDICNVIYQNADRHLACQFTFACDGKSKAIRDRRAWWRARRVARLTLDGKVWLAAVAKSTHYHAFYVSPAWRSEMRRMYRYGAHLFYRPYRWGDGEKEIGWVQAPLPVLKPKATSSPKPQASNDAKRPSVSAAAAPTKSVTAKAAPTVKAATASARPKMPPPHAQANNGSAKNSTALKTQKPSAAQAKATANTSKTNAETKQKIRPAKPQAKGKPEKSAKPASNSRKPLPAHSQASSAKRVSLN